MIRQILTDENPLLRAMSREVTLEELETPEVKQVIDDMLQTLKATTGVGLAAPQIGQLLRIVIVDKPRTIIVNPVVTPYNDVRQECYEGCLSVPGQRGVVERHLTVRVQGLTRLGKAIDMTMTNFRANVIQHEEDHLNGILYTDRATAMYGDDTVHAPAPRGDADAEFACEADAVTGRKTYVVQSGHPVNGDQYVQWQFADKGRVSSIRVSPAAAMVTGVYLSGVKLRARGFKIGAVDKMLLGEQGLHVAAGDVLRIEFRMPAKKKIVAEADFDG